MGFIMKWFLGPVMDLYKISMIRSQGNDTQIWGLLWSGMVKLKGLSFQEFRWIFATFLKALSKLYRLNDSSLPMLVKNITAFLFLSPIYKYMHSQPESWAMNGVGRCVLQKSSKRWTVMNMYRKMNRSTFPLMICHKPCHVYIHVSDLDRCY